MTCASPTAASGRWHSTPAEGSVKTSRRHRIIDHGSVRQGAGRVEGLITLVGGKLTTFRATSSEVAEHIFRMPGMRKRRVDTARLPLPGGDTDIIDTIPEWFPQWYSMPREVTTRLTRIYGSRVSGLSDLINRDAGLADPIEGPTGPLKAEVVHGFEYEMAQTLVDLLVRRMMAAWTPSLGLDRVEVFADVARQYLGWSEQRALGRGGGVSVVREQVPSPRRATRFRTRVVGLTRLNAQFEGVH